MIRRAPSRATSSSTSLSSRPEPNRASISPRIFSVGDTRDGTGVVLPVQTLAVLYGTHARRHLHRRMDTAAEPGKPAEEQRPSTPSQRILDRASGSCAGAARRGQSLPPTVPLEVSDMIADR